MVPHCGSCLIPVFPTFYALLSPDVSSDSHVARLVPSPLMSRTLARDLDLRLCSYISVIPLSTHTRSEPCAPSLSHLESDEHTQEARNIDVLGFHPLPRGPTICRHYLPARRARPVPQGHLSSLSRIIHSPAPVRAEAASLWPYNAAGRAGPSW